MLKASGVIEAVARSGKAFKLESSDDWYSVFKATQLKGEKGDSVAFEYKETEKGGQTYRNVQGDVNVTSAAPRQSTPGGGSATTKDVTITRLSLLKTAGDLVAGVGVYEGDVEAATSAVIDVAEALEAYVYKTE